MNLRLLTLFTVFCVSALISSSVHATETEAAKAKKPKKAKKAAKPERAVSDSTWSAMVDRDIIVVSQGREIRGRLAGHDADNATVIAPDGTIADVSKDDVSEVRADMTRKQDREPEPVPRAASGSGREAVSADDGLGPRGSFRRRGSFLLLSPGILAVPFSEPVMYRWGVSVGEFIPGEKSKFAGSYGFTFEHFTRRITETYTDYDPYYGSEGGTVNLWTHRIRALAEFRLGGSNQRAFGYALLGFGGTVFHATASSDTNKATDTTLGLAIPIGAGLQGLIGERFVIGVEPRVVFDMLLGSGITTMFDARLVLGARF